MVGLAEKMKEILKLTEGLDKLDKQAWMEIVDCVEEVTQEKLVDEIDDGQEEGMKVWREIFPFVQMIRLGLASSTLSRAERGRIVNAVLRAITGLLSPVELAGLCFTAAFNSLHGSQRRTMPIIIPFPFGDMEFEKKDETKAVV